MFRGLACVLARVGRRFAGFLGVLLLRERRAAETERQRARDEGVGEKLSRHRILLEALGFQDPFLI
jgi:hypothetical protein